MAQRPTIVTVPCLSGATWAPEQLWPFEGWPVRRIRLPDGPTDVEGYADVVARAAGDLDEYVLVGDSFGAVVALALATRRPDGLRALAISGAAAPSPGRNTLRRLACAAAGLLPGPLYRSVVLRFHASALASPFDAEGQVPWTPADVRELYLWNTPRAAFVSRVRAALGADYRERLGHIAVPTLILTPAHDRLGGAKAARVLLDGIPDAEEIILPRTGHLFRHTHPVTYGAAVRRFLEARLEAAAPEGAEQTAARA